MNLDRTFCLGEKDRCALIHKCDRHYDRIAEWKAETKPDFVRPVSVCDFSKDLKTPKTKCSLYKKEIKC